MVEKTEVVVAVSIYHSFENVVYRMCTELGFETDESRMRPCLYVLSGKIAEEKIDDLWKLEGVDLVQIFSLKLPERDAEY